MFFSVTLTNHNFAFSSQTVIDFYVSMLWLVIHI